MCIRDSLCGNPGTSEGVRTFIKFDELSFEGSVTLVRLFVFVLQFVGVSDGAEKPTDRSENGPFASADFGALWRPNGWRDRKEIATLLQKLFEGFLLAPKFLRCDARLQSCAVCFEMIQGLPLSPNLCPRVDV